MQEPREGLLGRVAGVAAALELTGRRAMAPEPAPSVWCAGAGVGGRPPALWKPGEGRHLANLEVRR